MGHIISLFPILIKFWCCYSFGTDNTIYLLWLLFLHQWTSPITKFSLTPTQMLRNRTLLTFAELKTTHRNKKTVRSPVPYYVLLYTHKQNCYLFRLIANILFFRPSEWRPLSNERSHHILLLLFTHTLNYLTEFYIGSYYFTYAAMATYRKSECKMFV